MIKKTLYLCFGVVTAAIFSINACSSSDRFESAQNEKEIATSAEKEMESADCNDQLSVWDTDLADSSRFTLNFTLTDAEKKLAKKFARTIALNLKRNEIYVHYLLSSLKEAELPLELAAIPLLESGLNARSRNGSTHGAWQYARSTGNALGLHKTKNYDAVYDFMASTDAGISYLKKLYSRFGNWEIVAAAYNAGEYGVNKAYQRALKAGIKEPDARDISISRATRAYIMKFKAYSDVLKNPSEYGVELPSIKNRPAFRKVDSAGVNSLQEVAKISGAKLEILKKLNSGYAGDRIDPHRAIYLPLDNAAELEKAVNQKDSVASNSRVSTEPLLVTK
ncbi:MAG: transglycosylase SLT domain-containing protein [Succinivibrio sp.]